MKRIALAIALTVILAGCGDDYVPHKDRSNYSTNGPFVEETVTLRDGSTITCLTYDRALDCDWTNR